VYFSQGRVLAACAKEVAEGIEGDTAIATLVEQRKGFFVVGGCLRLGLISQLLVRMCDWVFWALKG